MQVETLDLSGPKIAPVIPTITKGANRKTQAKISKADYEKAIEVIPMKNPLMEGEHGWAAIDQEKHYHFREFSMAEDIDPYFARTFQLTIEQCMKEGFELVGPDSELVDTIDTKIKMICHHSRTHFHELIENMISGLTRFNNAVMVFVRRPPNAGSVFKAYKHRGRDLNPIAGIFYSDPQYMTPHKKNGKLDKWEYCNIDKKYKRKEFSYVNVFHSRWNVKSSSEVFGTPWTLPALDDVRMLRRLEEFVQMLISKHLFPLLHYRVGTDAIPSLDEENSTSEVAMVRAKVQDLPTEGVVVSSHRHEIVAVAQGESIMEIDKYLEHFDRRALTGCGLSDIDIGRGGTANRSTAQTLNGTRVDRCTRIQRRLEADFHEQLIVPLLLSMGKDPWAPENDIQLRFNPIDTEEARARDNHATGLFNAGLETHDEARKDIRRRAFTSPEEWDNTAMNTTQRIGADQGEQATEAAAKVKAETANKNQPANQHGKSTTKPKQNKG